MEQKGWFSRFILWRENHIKEKHFILILSFIVGLLTAAAAITLKNLIHWIQHLLLGNFDLDGGSLLYLLYPVVGILLAGLFVKYVVRDDISHGVTKILYAISQRKSRIKPHNVWSSLVASSVTIGFGGSVGAEAPIVLTGAAIGSNLGRLFKMEQKTLMLLVGCGAAGAIAGIFKAPIAGLVFVIEVLLLDLTMTSIMPLLITSVTAATVSYIFTGTEAMFKFSQTEVFEMARIPYVLLLGVFCGLVSLYFTRVMNKIEGFYRRLGNYWKKFIIAGVMLSVLIYLLPPLYGEGYDTIGSLLNGQFSNIMERSLFYRWDGNYWGILVFLAFILLTKVFASSATNAGGGCGGIFAPSLFLGCIAGFVFAHTSNYFDFTTYLSEKNFALLGMAGVMSAVMHAPLTGVFLIAELTGGYDLFLPLMIVSIGSYLTILMFEPHSIYSMRLAQKGELLTHHKDKAVLTLLNRDEVIEKDFQPVHPEMSLGEVVKVIAKSSRNVFPVIDHKGVFLGMVLLDNIRNIMFRPELYSRFHVEKFMVSPPAKIVINMPMEQIMKIFDDTKAWNLPVVDEKGHYVGFMSKSKIFNSYREVLVDNFSED
ncbi:CIC family chloride channel protein [Parabacteroides sp. PFB2-10]|uniref:chloride channel protein n=1 Tax=Parabacteroides sp. PFB2-10 TaxID=1742405 RepID=UPI00247596F9|nr:chloride channel protein [Parabacteroides sp. PFB2-10]MDH6312019.1 CIC family chloride channel protein [Parabacteroides sp. PFB2-10]MDL2244167.1 chloride channel protein [Parabacteroides sp. OttesenSCG-928-J18]